DGKFRLVRSCFTSVADEHCACEERVPGQLADDSYRQAVLRIRADKRVLNEEFAAVRVGHHALFELVELVLRKIFVYITPKNFILTAGLANDGFVLSGAAGVLTRIDEYDAVIREPAFLTARDLFVELGRIQVPVNASGFLDPVAVQLRCSIFSAQVFGSRFSASRSH